MRLLVRGAGSTIVAAWVRCSHDAASLAGQWNHAVRRAGADLDHALAAGAHSHGQGWVETAHV